MKKNMMRVLLAAMLVLNLAACGGGVKTTCEFCGGKDKMCTEVTFWGENMYMCKDCKELLGYK